MSLGTRLFYIIINIKSMLKPVNLSLPLIYAIFTKPQNYAITRQLVTIYMANGVSQPVNLSLPIERKIFRYTCMIF